MELLTEKQLHKLEEANYGLKILNYFKNNKFMQRAVDDFFKATSRDALYRWIQTYMGYRMRKSKEQLQKADQQEIMSILQNLAQNNPNASPDQLQNGLIRVFGESVDKITFDKMLIEAKLPITETVKEAREWTLEYPPPGFSSGPSVNGPSIDEPVKVKDKDGRVWEISWGSSRLKASLIKGKTPGAEEKIRVTESSQKRYTGYITWPDQAKKLGLSEDEPMEEIDVDADNEYEARKKIEAELKSDYAPGGRIIEISAPRVGMYW